MTALHFAATSNQQNTVKLLLKLGANVEAVETRRGRSPLLCRAVYNADKVVVALLEHGCNTEAAQSDGLTPQMVALQILQRHVINKNSLVVNVPSTPLSIPTSTGTIGFEDLSYSLQAPPLFNTQRRSSHRRHDTSPFPDIGKSGALGGLASPDAKLNNGLTERNAFGELGSLPPLQHETSKAVTMTPDHQAAKEPVEEKGELSNKGFSKNDILVTAAVAVVTNRGAEVRAFRL